MAIKEKGTGADNNRILSVLDGDDSDGDLWPDATKAAALAGQEAAQGFVISMTDPRGNLTTGEFDAKGNRVKVKFPTLPGSEADLPTTPTAN